uniref:RNase H type-1 domain-containing protein n=1 Tax=Trichogramma kaykai TaxID=54128 RepID=A0ABD2VXB5_9HYME
MSLDGLESDLEWWSENISTGCKDIRFSQFAIEIFTDASLTGWESACKGKLANGTWTLAERKNSINFLELKAALFGLKCFAAEFKDCRILLRIDNTIAIAYINKMGGVMYENLNSVTREIWQWCENRNISIFASYIRSSDNVEADEECRKLTPETEFELADYAFDLITETFGEPEIDLFATRTNKKCDTFISWKRDPESETTDAFTISWKERFFYTFPPFSPNLILNVLKKIKNEKANGILVETPSSVEIDYPGGRECIRAALIKQGVPKSAIDVSLALIGESTIKSYIPVLKKWWSFCRLKRENIFRPTSSQVIEFLQTEFDRGMSHSSLNLARSAISLVATTDIGNYQIIRRFFRGVIRLHVGSKDHLRLLL